jgi:hypothetical protein
LGIGPNPQSPIPNPQSPIPIFSKKISEYNSLHYLIYLIKIIFNFFKMKITIPQQIKGVLSLIGAFCLHFVK